MTERPCHCGESKYQRLFTAKGFCIGRCLACQQVRTVTIGTSPLSTDEHYDERYAQGYEANIATYDPHYIRVVSLLERYRQAPGELLDVGCGTGGLIRAAQKSGWHATGVDISEANCAQARKYGLTADPVTIFQVSHQNGSLDVITANHVLEHVDQPVEFVRKAFQLLKNGGLLVIGVPNFGSFMSRIYRDRWVSLHPEDHIWQFSPRTLQFLLTQAGFAPQAIFFDSHSRKTVGVPIRYAYQLLDVVATVFRAGEAMLLIAKKP